MNPYVSDADFTLYVGDVRDVLVELADCGRGAGVGAAPAVQCISPRRVDERCKESMSDSDPVIQMEIQISDLEAELAILTEQRDNHLNRLLKEREEHEREIALLRGLLDDYRSALAAERGGGTPLAMLLNVVEAAKGISHPHNATSKEAAKAWYQLRSALAALDGVASTGVRDDPPT